MFRTTPPSPQIRPGDYVTVLVPTNTREAIGMRIVSTTKRQWTLAPWGHRVPDWPSGTELVLRASVPEGVVIGTGLLANRGKEWTLTIQSLRLSNRRRSERIPIKVRVLYGATTPELVTYTRDLGLHGCVMNGRSPGMVGEPCHVELHWGVDRSIRLLAQIVRVEQFPPLAFAVAFMDNSRVGWDHWTKAWRDIQRWHQTMNA